MVRTAWHVRSMPACAWPAGVHANTGCDGHASNSGRSQGAHTLAACIAAARAASELAACTALLSGVWPAGIRWAAAAPSGRGRRELGAAAATVRGRARRFQGADAPCGGCNKRVGGLRRRVATATWAALMSTRTAAAAAIARIRCVGSWEGRPQLQAARRCVLEVWPAALSV